MPHMQLTMDKDVKEYYIPSSKHVTFMIIEPRFVKYFPSQYSSKYSAASDDKQQAALELQRIEKEQIVCPESTLSSTEATVYLPPPVVLTTEQYWCVLCGVPCDKHHCSKHYRQKHSDWLSSKEFLDVIATGEIKLNNNPIFCTSTITLQPPEEMSKNEQMGAVASSINDTCNINSSINDNFSQDLKSADIELPLPKSAKWFWR